MRCGAVRASRACTRWKNIGMRCRRAGMARQDGWGGKGDRRAGGRGAVARYCGRCRVLRRHQGLWLHSDCPPGRAQAPAHRVGWTWTGP